MRRDTVTPAKILPVIKGIGAANLTGDFARAGRCIKRYIFDCNWPPRCIRIGRGVSARCRANARAVNQPVVCAALVAVRIVEQAYG